LQVLGAGGGLGGPAHTDVNFGGKKTNLGAAPHDWGFAKKAQEQRKVRLHHYICLKGHLSGSRKKPETTPG